jgi:3-oxoacyl-[acyl-carrier-protein] synthase-3
MKGYGVTIAGIGRYAPAGILSNGDLEKLVETSDEWIVQRTGMRRRHIASPEQATSDIAIPAAKAALEATGRQPSDVDCVIVATATPDYLFPATACIVASALGMTGKPAFDISIACSGFIYGMTTAASLIRAGAFKSVLLIGAETLSKIVDYTDRSTCVLFGDGAGAALFERSDEDCFLGSELGADGADPTVLYLRGGGSRLPFNTNGKADRSAGFVQMQGQAVFKFAVNMMAQSSRNALARADLKPEDADFLVPHQANARIIDATVKMLKLPPSKCVTNIQEYGNTSSASIPLALCDAVADGRIQPGNVVVFTAFGGGLSWGAVAWRWGSARVGKLPQENIEPERPAHIVPA